MSIKEVIFRDSTESSRRKAILDNLGKPVILRDEHAGWQAGTLLSECDRQCYYMQVNRRKVRHHYHDLVKLLVGEYSDFRMFESANLD